MIDCIKPHTDLWCLLQRCSAPFYLQKVDLLLFSFYCVFLIIWCTTEIIKGSGAPTRSSLMLKYLLEVSLTVSCCVTTLLFCRRNSFRYMCLCGQSGIGLSQSSICIDIYQNTICICVEYMYSACMTKFNMWIQNMQRADIWHLGSNLIISQRANTRLSTAEIRMWWQ